MSNALFHAAVYILIRDEKGGVLLHQRAGTDFLPGYWDFPSGHVELDESFVAAAVRELCEETSLSVHEQDLSVVQVSINHIDLPYINVFFEARAWEGTPTIVEPHKCTGMKFFALDDLPEKLTLGVRTMQAQQFEPDVSARSFVDLAGYEQLMGEPFRLQPPQA